MTCIRRLAELKIEAERIAATHGHALNSFGKAVKMGMGCSSFAVCNYCGATVYVRTYPSDGRHIVGIATDSACLPIVKEPLNR